MSYTLRNVLDDIASFVNQDPALVTDTDLTSQVNLVNQSQNEWAEAYEWKQLRIPVAFPVFYSASSIALSDNFKKLQSPVYDKSQSPFLGYEEIEPRDRFDKEPTDRYVTIQGDQSVGYSLQINPPLASGASLVADIQITPSAAATLQDIMVCPSRAFLVSRTIAKILSARSDSRFPTFKSESDDLLGNMIEVEATRGRSYRSTPEDYYTRRNFRIGE